MAVDNRIDDEQVRSEVRKHYAGLARGDQSTQQDSCCGPDQDSTSLIYEVPQVDDLPQEVRSISAGCGDPVTLAELEPGQTVLDLGSGGGIDCFLAAQQVGPTGMVIGVDMTPDMLEKARANQKKVGMDNVEFRLGEIEHLPVPDVSVDVIISNCVINLSTDKAQVFREAFRVLRSGGKFAVSDIVADGPLPEQLEGDATAWACCLGGAIDKQEFIHLLEQAGFVDVTLEPQGFRQPLAEDMLKLVDQESREDESSAEPIPHINIIGEWIPLELGGRKPPFSARITARKP